MLFKTMLIKANNKECFLNDLSDSFKNFLLDKAKKNLQ